MTTIKLLTRSRFTSNADWPDHWIRKTSSREKFLEHKTQFLPHIQLSNEEDVITRQWLPLCCAPSCVSVCLRNIYEDYHLAVTLTPHLLKQHMCFQDDIIAPLCVLLLNYLFGWEHPALSWFLYRFSNICVKLFGCRGFDVPSACCSTTLSLVWEGATAQSSSCTLLASSSLF